MRCLQVLFGFLCGVIMAVPGLTSDAPASVRYLRIYADEAGESHFEERHLTLQPLADDPAVHGLSIHQLAGTEGAAILHLARGSEEDWHTAPRRWFLVVLQGISEVTVSSGEVRRLTPGAMLLMDDTHGRGHKTAAVGEEDHVALVVPVAAVEGLL